ncbi:MAG TPA: AraC family transcriptional regulator [Povalibacter sp.]|nr:AraC family transcriptional regulator [Povalibacter sp.]
MALLRVLRRGAVEVIDYRCTSGPGDRAFVEVHARHSLSFVRRGSFGCRSRGRTLDLIPGALLVGYPGDEYCCSHEHHRGGDECLSFQYTPELIEEIAPRADWRVGTVPPLAGFMVLGERAQAAAGTHDSMALDELGLQLAAGFAGRLSPGARRSGAPRRQDRCRAIESALWIDAHAAEDLGLADAARIARLSNYHFLRVFSAVLGVTPHQYLVRSRLRTAARLLLEGSASVTDVAFDAGFNDVSNFVRTFRRAVGMSPGAFRHAGNRRSKILQDRFPAHS